MSILERLLVLNESLSYFKFTLCDLTYVCIFYMVITGNFRAIANLDNNDYVNKSQNI